MLKQNTGSENESKSTRKEIVSKDSISKPKKRLHFFSSFEEMNHADDIEMAKKSGIVHLANATAMIQKLYEVELKSPFVYRLRFK